MEAIIKATQQQKHRGIRRHLPVKNEHAFQRKAFVVSGTEVIIEERDLAEPPSLVSLIDNVLDGWRGTRGFLRPSLFLGCDRANVFQYRSEKQEPAAVPNNLQRILDNGTAVHEVVQGYLANHPGIFFAPEARVFLEVEGVLVKGSCDGVLVRRSDGYKWGLELKTINTKEFAALKKPKPEHVVQASIYAALMGLGWITVLYWDKNNNQLKEFPVRFDRNRWEAIRERVLHLKGFIEEEVLPDYDAKTCNKTFCRYLTACRNNPGGIK